MNEDRQELPSDLEEMDPGPELAAVLAAVDRKRLDDRDRVRLLQARHRMIAHLQAEHYSDMYALTWDEPPDGDGLARGSEDEPYPWAQTELAMALRWTKLAAGIRLDHARRLVEDLPAVHRSLREGLIDVPKALLILDQVLPLELDVARRIVEQVLIKAPQLTTGQLRVWLRRLVMAADPHAAAKEATEQVKARRVVASLNDANLGDLAGYDLAPHRVAASWERINAIAKAAKATGDPRRMDALRADILLDLVIGEGIAVGEPITDGGLGTPDDHDNHDDRPATSTGSVSTGSAGTGSAGTGQDPDRAKAAATTADGGGSEPGPAAAGGETVATGGGEDPIVAMMRRWRASGVGTIWPAAPADPSLLDPQADPPLQPTATAPVEDAAPGPPPEPPDEHQQPGWFRDAEQELLRRFWLAGFDQLPTTRPPVCPTCRHQPSRAGPAQVMPAPRKGVLDVHVSLYTLLGLDELPAELAGFGPMLADVARKLARQRPDLAWKFNIYDQHELLARIGTSKRPTRIPAGPTTGRRTNRRPTTEVAGFVRARNRSCIRPGCRRDARSCELDHSKTWADHGESEPNNLGPACPGDHDFRHSPGCRLIQAATGGRFGWITPKGMRYVTTPDPPLYDDLEVVDPCR